MKRRPSPIWGFVLYPTRFHILGVLVSLVCCFPILFPELCPPGTAKAIHRYCGIALLGAMGLSTLLMLLSAATHMLRLSNTRAFTQFFKWLSIWCAGLVLYILLAIAADVPPPNTGGDNQPIQDSDTLYTPRDQLNGPASLVIPIDPEGQNTDKLALAPNLQLLEKEHAALFKSYIETSPRWSGQDGDDTFYSKPGHLVMVPPTSSGAPGLVHVCFRQLIEGDPLPQGYAVVQPGGSFPEIDRNNPQIPDIAVDLGRNHFLLLAWRGSAHRETAFSAINAAIAATDARMQPLLDSPAQETVQRMLNGRHSYPGKTPELRLSEPLAQEGAYQAELYANPGEPGVILVYIKDLSTGETLRLLNCPARYSSNPGELFRHDIPGSMPNWIRSSTQGDISNIFPENTPLFAIRIGPQHQYFGVAFEVWFKPSDVRLQRRLLLRRCYKVQAYEPPVPETQENVTQSKPAPSPATFKHHADEAQH